jgi:hypothetical protein
MKLITREQGGARPPRQITTRPFSEIKGFCWHHAGSILKVPWPGTYAQQMAAEIRMVQAGQNWSMDEHGYSDIDYHALIGPSGNIYEGRASATVEAAQSGTWAGKPANHSLIGVCFLGDFTQPGATLTKAAMDAAKGVVWLTAVGLQSKGATFKDHLSHNALHRYGGIATACPGNPVRAYVHSAFGAIII